MRIVGFLALGFVVMMTSGCAVNSNAEDAANKNDPVEPNMTAELSIGHSSDAILSKYGKPLYKKGRVDTDGKKLEDWFYPTAILSFKEGSLNAFKPK